MVLFFNFNFNGVYLSYYEDMYTTISHRKKHDAKKTSRNQKHPVVPWFYMVQLLNPLFITTNPPNRKKNPFSLIKYH